MHIQTHILSGWCAGNLLPLNARQRLFCMIAASIADVDGFGILLWPIDRDRAQQLYWDYHHVLGHCALFGVLVSIIFSAFSPQKVRSFVIYLALFHLHLVLDVLGSGPGWKIYYFWPVSGWGFAIDWGWALFSWQNIATFFILLAWTVSIARRYGRTPLEAIMPRLDAKITLFLQSIGRRKLLR
jgi:inner membrane protein